MRRSADEIAQLRFHFGRKCLASRHRLLTEFFPPIVSARSVGANESPSNNSRTMGIERLATSTSRRLPPRRHPDTSVKLTATTHFGWPKRLTPRLTNTASATIADVHRDQIL